jgi:hypothetical protein
MGRTRTPAVGRVVALAVCLLVLTWGVGAGVSGAQVHHDDHGHGGHGSSTTTTSPPGSTTTTTRPAPNPGTQTKTVRYGPYTIQPGTQDPGGHGHQMLEGFQFNVEKPCTDCYITRMVPDLVKADGTRAGYSNGVMLHHMVLANRQAGRTDATCSTTPPLSLAGQRFFAAGDERTVAQFPTGYGYKVGADSAWVLIWELMSMSNVPETVFYEVTFEYVPASTPGMKDLEPVWLDADQCGSSHVSIPAGPSAPSWTWDVNRPGDVISVVGHLHDHGVNLEIRNDATGQRICDSVAGYGEGPLYTDHEGTAHISSMTTCLGTADRPGIASVASGQRVTMTGHYNAPAPVDDAMALAIMYLGEGGSPGGTGCTRAMNSAHVTAGRAAAWLIFVWAKGSNEYIGLTWDTTALREDPAGTFRRVTAC